MKAGLKIPVGVALFAVLALAGMMGIFAVNAPQQVHAQTPSSNASLMSLSVSYGSTTIDLDPGFNPSIYRYMGSVPNSVDEVDVAASAAHSRAFIETGDGPYAVVQGNNFINITVVAEDDTRRTYFVIIVVEPQSDDAQLESLTITEGDTDTVVALNPVFMASTMAYEAEVSNGVTTVTVTAEEADSNAQSVGIEAEGTGANATDDVVMLATSTDEDSVTTITITVTAEDGSTEDYVVEVTRKAQSDNADLRSLSVRRTLSSGPPNDRPHYPKFRGGHHILPE